MPIEDFIICVYCCVEENWYVLTEGKRLRQRGYAPKSCTTRIAGSMRKPPIRGHEAYSVMHFSSLVNPIDPLFFHALLEYGYSFVSPTLPSRRCLHSNRSAKTSNPQNTASSRIYGATSLLIYPSTHLFLDWVGPLEEKSLPLLFFNSRNGRASVFLTAIGGGLAVFS